MSVVEKVEWLSATKLRAWFGDVLDEHDPKPSIETCEKLARQFQTIVKRHNKAELERRGHPVDRSFAEEIDKKVGKIRALMQQALDAMSELEDFGGFRGSMRTARFLFQRP